MPFHRAVDLNVPNVRGSEKVGAQQEQDDVSFFKVLVYGGVEVFSSKDPAVVPIGDHTRAFQGGKVLVELVPEASSACE